MSDEDSFIQMPEVANKNPAPRPSGGPASVRPSDAVDDGGASQPRGRPLSAIQVQKLRIQQQQQQQQQQQEEANLPPQPQPASPPVEEPGSTAPTATEDNDAGAPEPHLPSPTIPSFADRNPTYTRHTLPLGKLFDTIRSEFLAVEKATLPMNQYNFSTSMRYPTLNRYSNILAIEETLFPAKTVPSGDRRRDCPRPVFTSTKDESPTKSAAAGSGFKALLGKSLGGNPNARRGPPPPPLQSSGARRSVEEPTATATPPPFLYINGNVVKLQDVEPTFVACQAPLPNAFEDFYKTIWQHRIRLVIMLTGVVESGMMKADRYWPASDADVRAESRIWPQLCARREMMMADMNASLGSAPSDGNPREDDAKESSTSSTATPQDIFPLPGDMLGYNFGENKTCDTLLFNSLCVTMDKDAPYTTDPDLKLQVRPLIVQPRAYLMEGGGPASDPTLPPPLKVLQVQYTGWPDHGVPTSTDSFNALIKLIHENIKSSKAEAAETEASHTSSPAEPPVLVHCSAGIGRTGSLIGAYAALELMKKGLLEDGSMAAILTQMRRGRYGMVQRIEQYMYMYEFILKNMGYKDEAAYEAGVARQVEIYSEEFMAALRASRAGNQR